MNDGHYTCTHYYWDEMDREYTIEGTWNFERNYPDMPNHWHLEELEIIEQERNAPDICIDPKSDVWLHIERGGVDEERIKEVYYYG